MFNNTKSFFHFIDAPIGRACSPVCREVSQEPLTPKTEYRFISSYTKIIKLYQKHGKRAEKYILYLR